MLGTLVARHQSLLKSTEKCLYSTSYLLGALENSKKTVHQLSTRETTKSPSPWTFNELTNVITTPTRLNEQFLHEHYLAPTQAQVNYTQSFFNRSKFRLLWTVGNYDEIPDIKYERLKEAKGLIHNDHPKSSFGVDPKLLKPLPEVILLGHTNVGKSSLVNNLLLNKEENKSPGAFTEHSFVSRRAGYTKTLNCFDIGNQLRLIDSPGYGEYGEETQGEFVTEYISQRKQLRRAYVLIDASVGFLEEDLHIIRELTRLGIAFDIIFTKVDVTISKFMPKKDFFKSYKGLGATEKAKAKKVVEMSNVHIFNYFQTMIDAHAIDLISLPRFMFNNAQRSVFLKYRYGYKQIRFSILQSCGLV
ncbi:uncharacterized protein PRCAT00000123001 [Priceomyces carsonii]|uniref:uncharacterized protein n=1 Tax=Priceomyces carsonii TaxID=28549 RepID=UPI002EDA2842|nr:unnamed protein product [Priceomyces carsonii]